MHLDAEKRLEAYLERNSAAKQEWATFRKLKTGDPRVTRVGAWLRKYSLDELPQLLNVLKGDMSIVGPRPALYNQHELIDLRRRNRSDLLRPGLTGWAQINGRDLITQAEKVRLDEFYARNCSVMLDVRIVLRTGAVVLRVDEVK